MYKLSIPNPCHEAWDNMTTNTEGRHCTQCSKTVVDFTKMTEEEVKNFLVDRSGQRVCGRFSSTQLQDINIQLPQNIFQLQMPAWKQFLLAALIIFSSSLFSCKVNTQGDPVLNETGGQKSWRTEDSSFTKGEVDTMRLKTGLGLDTVSCHFPIIGEPSIVTGDIEIIPGDSVKIDSVAPFKMGELAPMPMRDSAPLPAPQIMKIIQRDRPDSCGQPFL